MNGAKLKKVKTSNRYSARFTYTLSIFLVAIINTAARTLAQLTPQYNKAKSVGRKKHAAVLQR